MNKKLIFYLAIGVIFVSVLGSLTHFFYEWSGNNRIIALFCPVNESTWEHMKLLFFPMLLYTWYIAKKLSDMPNILSAMLTGNLFGTFLIPVLFYTYSGALGYFITFIDISIFFFCTILAFCKVYILMRQKRESSYETILIGASLLVCILFFVFTFYPPHIALFIPE